LLALYGNQLTGPIPAELGRMAYLALNINQTGPNPTELGQLGGLTDLFLNVNPQLSGQEAFRGHMQEHHPDDEVSL
jgi:hypothetical protein